MTVIDKTHKRSNEFSNWLRDNLPDSQTGTLITDIDFVVKNWKDNSKMLFIEEKTNMGEVPTWQRKMIEDIIMCINKSGIMVAEFATITFERYNFEDGKVWLNGSESSEDEVKSFIGRYC